MASNQYDLEITIRTKKQGDGVEQAGKEVENFGKRLNSTLDTINKSVVAVAAAGATFGKAFDLAKEGASLEFTEQRFSRLAAAAGTTAAALEGDLKRATSGLVSDSQLVASATDFMALGLAKTHDETVRLTRVAGALDADMNQLVLTLTNQTTARFDALGVSVDGFDDKVNDLIATGLSAEDAFNEAFLRQAEEQIARTGDVADSSLASYQKLEAQIENVTDALKRMLAARNEGLIGGVANVIEVVTENQAALNEAVERGVITQEEYNDITHYITRGQYVSFVREAKDGLAELDAVLETVNNDSNQHAAQMEELSRLGREYTAVIGSSAVGAASDYGAELARLSQMGQEAAASSRDNIDAIKARREAFIGFFQEASDPVNELLDAQQALSDSQGEWVTRTVSSADQVAAVNAQLASDLSDDQAKAYRNILRTVDEGSAEWLDAYNRLQNDLTESQRDALVAQQADLANQPDRLVDVYTGDAEGAEEAQARITAANEAIKQSYRETAAEALLAQAAQNGNLAETLDVLVGIGYLSQAQADAQLEIANTNQAIQDLTASQTYSRLTTEEQTAALNALIEGTAQTADQAINLAEQQTAVNDALNAMPKAVVSTVTVRGLEDSAGRVGDLLRQLDALDGRNVSANVTVNTSTAQDLGNGGGKEAPKKAAGGSVFAGGLFQAGEGNLPELLRQKDGRLFVIPGDDGQVFSNQQSRGMLGGQTINDNRQTIINANTKEAAALALASAQVSKRTRFNRSMGV